MTEKVTTKASIIEAAIKACGKKFKAERYWNWRNKYSEMEVEKVITPETGKATFTYPRCGHTEEFSLINPECVKMKLADYHYPFCPGCREAAYSAACKEKEERREGLVSLGLAFDEA